MDVGERPPKVQSLYTHLKVSMIYPVIFIIDIFFSFIQDFPEVLGQSIENYEL